MYGLKTVLDYSFLHHSTSDDNVYVIDKDTAERLIKMICSFKCAGLTYLPTPGRKAMKQLCT